MPCLGRIVAAVVWLVQKEKRCRTVRIQLVGPEGFEPPTKGL